MRHYLKYLTGLGLLTLTKYVASNIFSDDDGNKPPDYGFGKAYKWRSFVSSWEEAKQTGKPIFMLIHKSTCPACQKLKGKFSRSVKLIDLSTHFVMMNVENSSRSINEDERFSPDGKYVPRILFFNSIGEFMPHVYNHHPDADSEHKYFYNSPGQIINAMYQIIDNKSHKFDEKSPK